ncbi:MAG: hypothetical protein AB7O96_18540, partial [Pseudobdellovibrionaceae bacterium]
MKAQIVFFLLCSLGLFSFADTASEKKIKIEEKYSFEQLHEAALYSVALTLKNVDAQVANKKAERILKCDPKPVVFDNWPMKIKSYIDTKAKKERQKYLALPVDKRTQDPKYLTCEKKCLCGAYSELLTEIDPTSLKEADLNLQKEMQKKHEAQSNEQMFKCAKETKWFCTSALRKEL